MMGVNQENKISMSICEALDTESLTYTVGKNPYLSKVLIRLQMKCFESKSNIYGALTLQGRLNSLWYQKETHNMLKTIAILNDCKSWDLHLMNEQRNKYMNPKIEKKTHMHIKRNQAQDGGPSEEVPLQRHHSSRQQEDFMVLSHKLLLPATPKEQSQNKIWARKCA